MRSLFGSATYFGLLSILVLTCANMAFAWPVDVLHEGKYAVATSNMEMRIPNRLTMDAFLVGNSDHGDPAYVKSLMVNPLTTLNITVTVPDDVELYGHYAGQPLSYVGYLVYPTAEYNNRPDYRFPYAKVQNTVFPRMDQVGDVPIPVPGNRRFPLIVSSHGHKSNGLWDLAHMKFLASHGYVALSIFHGDGRISDYSAQYSLRTLMTKAFIDYIVQHPTYRSLIDPTRIGISGSSFGSYTGLALLGGKYMGHPSSVVDSRIKAAFTAVPWVGDGAGDLPFQSDFSSLENVTAPVLAVIGERDQVANPDLAKAALMKTSGPTIAFQIKGEGHAFSAQAWKEAQTLEVLFFDANLKESTTAAQILLGTTYVYGEPSDMKILQRIPVGETYTPLGE